MNVFVQRMVERFGDEELDPEDAVAFAEKIIESATPQSVPARRELNLALVFLNMKYPFQCCGKVNRERCEDCPMRSYDLKESK